MLHAALELQELHVCIPPAESMSVRIDSVGMVHSEKWVWLRGRGTLPFQQHVVELPSSAPLGILHTGTAVVHLSQDHINDRTGAQ